MLPPALTDYTTYHRLLRNAELRLLQTQELQLLVVSAAGHERISNTNDILFAEHSSLANFFGSQCLPSPR